MKSMTLLKSPLVSQIRSSFVLITLSVIGASKFDDRTEGTFKRNPSANDAAEEGDAEDEVTVEIEK